MNSNYPIKKLFSLILFTALVAVAGCSGGGGGGGEGTSFYATDLTDNSVYRVYADLVYEGTYCIVYKESNDTVVSDDTAAAMGREFDANIYSRIVSNFGTPSDVDGNGKIILLLLDIIDGSIDSSYCAGYFDPNNDYDPAVYAYSNGCDMIYLDTDPGATNSAYMETFRLTMAHEFQHLICFYQKVGVQQLDCQFDTWIDEGFSSAAEKIYKGEQITDKTDYFNADYYGDIAQGQRFIAWNKGSYDSVLGNYAAVYLFFQWLGIQASNGGGIYKEIMNSMYCDYNALWSVKDRITDFTGSTFAELLRDWNIANLLCDGSGIYGYKGEITTSVHYINSLADNSSYPEAGSTRDMLPGECIYAKITADYVLADKTNISAAGINSTTSAIDTDNTTYTGDILLVYNSVAADSSTTSVTAILPPQVASVAGSRSVTKSAPLKKRLPVDAVLNFKGPLPVKLKEKEIIP